MEPWKKRVLEKAEKVFKGKSIDEAIALLHGWWESQIALVEGLWYMEQTKMFRQAPRYKKAEFADFLQGEFKMTYHQYTDLVNALPYEEECRRFGLGTAANIIKMTGTRCEKAFDRMKELEKEKGDQLRVYEIQEVAAQFEPRREKTPTSKSKPKTACHSCLRMRAEIQARDQMIAEKDKRIAELEAQVSKLKATMVKARQLFGFIPPPSEDDPSLGGAPPPDKGRGERSRPSAS